jgi:hypothetical protein
MMIIIIIIIVRMLQSFLQRSASAGHVWSLRATVAFVQGGREVTVHPDNTNVRFFPNLAVSLFVVEPY